MTPSAAALDRLKRQRPEWEPWLAVVQEVVRDAGSPAWDEAVPACVSSGADAMRAGAALGAEALCAKATPLLAGATIELPASAVQRLLHRLIRVASLSGTPKMGTLTGLSVDRDALTLFRASLCQDTGGIEKAAARSGVDAEALQAVIALLSVPFLQACNRRWGPSIAESWVDAYCPICGSWPAFAEVRGIERSRHFRCGRCGGAWHARALHCPYCDMRDHDSLVSLVPENTGSQAVIDACTRCLGYLKTFSRLQGCLPGAVMLEDLATVDLDVAALEQGYTRPPGAACPLEITVKDRSTRRRYFTWNA